MRDEKFLVRSLFFSSRTSENARTSDLGKRETKSLFEFKTEEGKNSAQKTASSSVQRRTSFALSIKNSKKQQTNFFYNRQRENNEKIRRRRSPLGRNSTHHFVVLLIYINRSHLK